MRFINKLYSLLSQVRNPKLYSASIIYLLASFVGYGISFVQNFSFAFFLSVEFFGKVTILFSLFSTLYILFTLGLNSVVMRFFFDKKYAANERQFVSTIVVIWFFLGLCLCLLLIALGYFLILQRHFLLIDFYSEFLPILFGSFLFSFIEIFICFFIVKEEPLKYAISLVASRLTIFLLLHAAIYFFQESSFHFALSILFSGLTQFVIAFVIFRVYPVGEIDRSHVKEVTLYSLPLMLYALGGIGYSHGYRIVISNWLSLSNFAIFSFTAQVTQIYYLTASSSVTGFYPKAYKALEDSNGQVHSIDFYFRILLFLGLFLAVCVFPMGYLLLKYFKGGEYFEGTQILPVLFIGQFVFLLYGYNYILCTYYKKTAILTYSMLAGVTISILTAWALLPQSKLWGAALPTLAGLTVQFALSWFLVQRVSHKAVLLK